MKLFYDRKHQPELELELGDQVYVEGLHLSTDRPLKKLDDRRFGPFPVVEKVGSGAYKLRLPPTWKQVHPVFHVALLRKAVPPRSPLQCPVPPPPAVQVDGHTEYEVQKILDSRIHRRQLQYLVQWVGYGSEENTWEPEPNVQHAADAVAEFHRLHPGAPRRIAAVFESLPFQRYENFTESNWAPPEWEDGVRPGSESLFAN